MGTVGCLVSGGFGQSAARLNSPGLDPSAQADITVSSLAVKGTVGSRGVLHVETAVERESSISSDNVDRTRSIADSRVVGSSSALVSSNLVSSSSLVDDDFSLYARSDETISIETLQDCLTLARQHSPCYRPCSSTAPSEHPTFEAPSSWQCRL